MPYLRYLFDLVVPPQLGDVVVSEQLHERVVVVLVDGDECGGRIMGVRELDVAVTPCLGEDGPRDFGALEAKASRQGRAGRIEGFAGAGGETGGYG